MKKILLLFLLTILINNTFSQTQYLQGPFSGEVRVIVNDNLTLFAGTNAGGVYKSIDLGNNWIYIGLNGEAIRSIKADGDFIAVGTDNGLFLTTNGGANWNKVSSINSAVRSLAKIQNIIFAGTDNGVYSSSDLGANWNVPALTSSAIRALHIDINNIVYAGTSGQGLYRSTNGGVTWITSGISSGYVRSITSYAGFVYASMWGGVRRSSNGGTNWTSIGLDALDIPEIYVMSNLIYAATWEGVYKTINNGSSWELLGMSESITWSLLAISDLIVFVGRDGEGIYKTTNGGVNWASSNNGLNAARVWNIHQHNENTFFAGTSGGAYKTTDKGETWSLTASSIFANRYWSAFSVSENEILLGTSRGILRSTNLGENWTLITPTDYSVKQIVKHTNGTLFAGTTTGVIRSTDNGITWTVQNAGLINTSVTDMMITPNGQIYASTSGGSGLYRSTNNGGSWASVNVGATSIIKIGFDRFGHLYALSSFNLYKSTNNGSNWNSILTEINNNYFSTFSVNDSGDVYVGSNKGMYIGLEFGIQWLLAVFMFNNSNILSMTIAENFDQYIGTAGGGIIRRLSQYIPVELTSFSAFNKNNNVILNWSTASETNNLGFEIQRISPFQGGGSPPQMDGGGWEVVAFVEGNGTTTEINNYLYEDNNLSAGNPATSGRYLYRLKQIDFDGRYEYSKIVEIEIGLPSEFSLSQNYPNPFNPLTEIRYQITEDRKVSLIVYDIIGNIVSTLVNENQAAGNYNIKFDGSKLSTGVYYYRLISGNFLETKKMILIK